MILKKIQKHPLLLGTFLLTGAGFISRIMGFFYRIFLSHTIGASGLGLYQLIFPIFGLCLAISASGIQTALSRFVAAEKEDTPYLSCGLWLSILLSAFFSLGIYFFAPWIAEYILKEARTAELLRVLSFSLLPASMHACFNGYYYGKKNSTIPSICQISEQIARILGTFLIYRILQERGLPLEPVHAVWGLVISEFAGLLVNLTAYLGREKKQTKASIHSMPQHTAKALMFMAVPLTASHVLTTLCSSLENLLLPQQLMKFGYSSDEALGHFGILSGMALSVIFFPSAITNSLSVLLLPRISESKARGDSRSVLETIKGALCCGVALGSLCTFVFLFSADWIGTYIFESVLAGFYIRILSILCPFMYTSALLNSIVNGLGHASYTLVCNLSGCALRILAIWILVPIYGMYAYIISMIAASVLTTIELLIIVRAYCSITK